MTKNEKDNLVWRLKELPSAEGVSRLVEQGIITTDQAKEILFSKPVEKNTNEEINALHEQVKFLQGLIDRLVSQRSHGWTYVPYTYTINTPMKYWKNLTTYSSANTAGTHYDLDGVGVTMSVKQ